MNRKLALTTLLLASAGFAATLRADDDMPSEPVFISITRTPEPIDRLPTNVSVVTAEEIEKSGAKTLDQVLDRLPSVDVARTGTLGTFSTVRLRGAPASAQVQIVVDDRPVGGVSTQFFDLSQIPVENIERIEIVRGGSSVLYGANTIGGVVHVITKRHTEDRTTSSVGIEARSFKTQIYRGDLGMRGGGFDAYVNASRYFTDGFAQNSDANDVTLSGNGGYSFPNGARVALDVSHVNHDVGDPQGTFVPLDQWDGTKERASSNTTDRVHWDTNAGRFVVGVPAGPVHVQSTFYGSDQDYRITNSLFPADINNRILGNDTRFLLPAGLTLGAAYERDERESKGVSNLHVTDWGLYAQQMIGLGKLDLIPAIRFDQHGAFGNVYNPRFTVVYRLTENLKLSANASRSFRAPTLSQLYEDFPLFSFFGNPQLRPETAWTYDAGTEYRRGENLDVRITGFYTRIRDRITSTANPFPASNTNVNSPLAELSGVEAETSGRFGPFRQTANYTYQRAIGNALGSSAFVPLGLTPRHIANYTLYWNIARGWSVTSAVQYVHRQFEFSDETGRRLPSYTLWNARLAKKILSAELYAAVDNITDKHYAETFGFGTLNALPGRTYWGGLTIRFLD